MVDPTETKGFAGAGMRFGRSEPPRKALDPKGLPQRWLGRLPELG